MSKCKGRVASGNPCSNDEEMNLIILACVDFVNNSDNKLAIITSLDKALEALKGKTGTRIKK